MSDKQFKKKENADGKGLVWLMDDVLYAKEAQALLMLPSRSAFIDEKHLQPQTIDGVTIAPWGVSNLLPQHVMDKIEKVEVVGANADFNWRTCYGLGPKLQKLVYSDNPKEQVLDDKGNIIGGKVVERLDINAGKEYDWCQRSDISMYYQEVLTDLSHFANAFPVLLPEKEGVGIYSIVHREAMFSRWEINKDTGIILNHVYSSKWDDNPSKKDMEFSYVIDEFDDVLDIKSHLQAKTDRPERLCYPIYLASPGRPYYSYPNWYSIFRSGWYDHLASIPELKKAILKHNLGVKHIIYISPSYFEAKAKQAGISENDQKAHDELKKKLVDEINDALTGEENAGKALATLAKIVPSGNGTTIEKYFTIEKVDNNVAEGEYLTDYETGANVVSYAMGVHPNLIGATPGKNSNSLSGSNIREIFLMKQALSKPMIDRAMRPFAAIKKINNWPTDYVLTLSEYTFTTLDEAKSGKKETQNTAA
jgi:hypothetical protein